MKLKEKRTLFIQAGKSLFTSWALMKAARMEPGNVFTLIFFLVVFFFYREVYRKLADSQKADRRMRVTAAVLAVIYTLCYMLLDASHYIEALTNRMFQAGILAATAIGFWALFDALLKFLFLWVVEKEKMKELFCEKEQGESRNPFATHPLAATFIVCLLGWLPYFLYQFPGIMTPDSINQLEQVLGIVSYSNHHPWVHTLLIKVFYSIGFAITGNMVYAMGFYTFAQMCIMAFATAYFVSSMRFLHLKAGWCTAMALVFAILPYHAVYAVTVWKDIPFAAAVLVFITSLLRLRNGGKWQHAALFVLSGTMMCLFRSNGWYAFLVCVPFFVASFWKKNRKVIGLLAVSLLAAVVVKYPVMNGCRVTPPDFVESLCIPIQQVSYVLANDRELSLEQLELIDAVIDRNYVKNLYNPEFADNMKELVRAGHPEYLEAHKKEFFRLWLDLLIRYPGDYLEAYIQQTNGYWYPDSYYPVADAEGISATDLGISHTPLIRGSLVVKGKEIAVKLGSMVPVYGTLWSMGVAFWILLLMMGCVLVRREEGKLLYALPCLLLWGTVMIATPVATEFRYVYFLMLCMPFYLCMMVLEETPQTCIDAPLEI